MHVKIWGSRGSIPSPCLGDRVREKIARALELSLGADLTRENINSFVDSLPFWVRSSYGGNTPCVQVTGPDEYLICDLGSGARCLGNHLLKTQGPGPHVFHVLISHLHWDHIQGLPFFPFIYIPGNVFYVYGAHSEIERAFAAQQSSPFFPVDFHDLPSTFEFRELPVGEKVSIAGFSVSAHEQNHPGKSYGFRVERKGKVFVYATDCEHGKVDICSLEAFSKMAGDADFLIFDSQYTFVDHCTSKKDWGHSSNLVGVELCKLSGVKRLCLFHLDPAPDDQRLDEFLEDTRSYAQLYMPAKKLEVFMAYDGLEFEL